MEKSDWDELAFRLSRYLTIKNDDDFAIVKAKLKNVLSKDSRSANLVKPQAWKKLWRNVVPRLMDLGNLKKGLYKRSGGKGKSFNRDKNKTAQRVVSDFSEFEKRTPSKVDMNGVDTKDGKFIKR